MRIFTQLFLLLLLFSIAVTGCKKPEDPICENQLLMISSSCTGSSNQAGHWEEDAQRLALRQLHSANATSLDSVYVPQSEWQPMLDLLYAVDNALPEIPCENLNHLHNVHTFPDIMVREMLISLDTTVDWVQQWRTGNEITGNAQVDSLMTGYQLSLVSYEERDYGVYAVIMASEALNTEPLLIKWRTIVGVVEAYENTVVGDGNDIRYQEGNGFDQLEFSIGRGDCPSGCINRDIWTFRIYTDCAVEYMGMRTD